MMNRCIKLSLTCVGLAPLLFVCATHVAGQPPAKTPVPDQSAQAKALKLVLDIFGPHIAKADASGAKSRIASEIFQQGKEVKDDSTLRYVCWAEARKLAAKGADVNLTLVIIDETSRQFDVDAMLLKAEALAQIVAGAIDKEAGQQLVDAIRPLWNEAVDLDHYKAAHILGDAAVSAAKKAQSISTVLALQKRIAEIQAIELNFNKLHVYQERLKKKAADGEANLELGKYFGYQKRRWERALKHFAECSDAGLKQLARLDLTEPREAKDQLALADGWWLRARTEPDFSAKLATQVRAMHWYDKAVAGLAGLNRTKAIKRMEVVQDQLTGTAVAQPVVGPAGEFKKFEGHADEVKGVALSQDGRYAASVGRDQTVRVWDLTTGKEAHMLKGHTKEVWSVAFHPNSRYVLSASWDATVRMWDFKTGNEVNRWTHTKDVNSVVLSRDGGVMLTGSDDEKVYQWNVTTGEEVRKYSGHSNYVYAAAFAPDGRHIASGGVDKTVRVFDLNTGQLVKTFEGHNESVTNVAFTNDSRYVLSSGDSVIHVWDMTTGKQARKIEGHTGRIPAMAISSDGRSLATGSEDKTIKIWDVATGKLQHTFTGHTDTVTSVAFSHDGRRLVSGGYDRTVRVWSLPAR